MLVSLNVDIVFLCSECSAVQRIRSGLFTSAYSLLPPAPPPPPPQVLNPPPSTASKETIESGRQQFVTNCTMCHEPPAANRAAFPDLRFSPTLHSAEAFSSIVLGGALQANGMASFKGRLTEDQAQAVRAYIVSRANEAKAAGGVPRAP
jgi:mono/diheme cytochrome c family protein